MKSRIEYSVAGIKIKKKKIQLQERSKVNSLLEVVLLVIAMRGCSRVG